MNKQDYFKKVWNKGRLIVGYTDLKALGLTTSIVMARLNTEYNYALGHKLLISGYFFSYDENEIAESICIAVNDVKIAINKLKELDFVETQIIDDCPLIHLELDNIYNYIYETERKNDYKNWDYYLQSTQYKGFSSIELNSENKKLIETIKNERYELARDENGNVIQF